jgi:hypothetical protein
MTSEQARAAAKRCELYRVAGFFVSRNDVQTYELALFEIEDKAKGKPQ